MQCILCKTNEAKVHLTKIIGDKMQKIDLCEECAKQKGVNDPAGFSLADLLFGLGAAQELSAGQPEGEDVKCPNCGFSQADFKKAGRLGCSICYATFSAGLESLLKSMHKGTRHIGKVPFSLKQSRDLANRVVLLQKKLDKAVTDENFEQAARLRDEIREARLKLGAVAAP
jgi:protein arginine kinase activator